MTRAQVVAEWSARMTTGRTIIVDEEVSPSTINSLVAAIIATDASRSQAGSLWWSDLMHAHALLSITNASDTRSRGIPTDASRSRTMVDEVIWARCQCALVRAGERARRRACVQAPCTRMSLAEHLHRDRRRLA